MLKFRHTSPFSCSDDGLWMANGEPITYKNGCKHHFIAVIELNYWENLDSSCPDKYDVSSGWVHFDPYDTQDKSVIAALKSCGWEFDKNGDIWAPYTGDIIVKRHTAAFNYCLAECLWSWGAKDLAYNGSGNNRKTLIRAAKGAL